MRSVNRTASFQIGVNKRLEHLLKKGKNMLLVLVHVSMLR